MDGDGKGVGVGGSRKQMNSRLTRFILRHQLSSDLCSPAKWTGGRALTREIGVPRNRKVKMKIWSSS